MKQKGWSILLTLTIILAACGNPTSVATSSATLETTQTVENHTVESSNVVVASAHVLPAQVSQMAFTISALVKEIVVKEGDTVEVGQSLMTLDVPELEYAVIAAEAAYQSAALNAQLQDADRIKVVNEFTGRVIFVSLPYEVKFKAIAKADQNKALLEIAQANLAQATLIAPYDGTIVSINVIPGELAQAAQVVITLATLDALQIETTDLSERDITRVKIGQSVDVYVEALNETFSGKVIRISPIAETVGGDVVFPVTIELDEQPEGLLWGMTAEVEIK